MSEVHVAIIYVNSRFEFTLYHVTPQIKCNCIMKL